MKKLILRSIAMVAVLAAVTVTFAAGTTADVSWVMPTVYQDGTALPVADIASTTISWAPATGQEGPSGSVTVTSPGTSAVVPVACGEVTFTAAVTTTASAKYPNATSGPSNGVPYATGVTCKPNPPSGLAVQ